MRKFDNSNKIKYLKWWDILIVTVIMFGSFIVSSLKIFLYSEKTASELSEFTNAMNWESISLELILITIAFIYLYVRKFNFCQFKININIKSIVKGIVLFIGIALIFDLYFLLTDSIIIYSNVDESVLYASQEGNLFLERLSNIDISLILFAILNGFYEEVFFLGICLSVAPKNRKYYFIYSLIVRYCFHTYQGNISALGIGFLLGAIYYFLYTKSKDKNLFPFFLSHSIADIFGLGIINYFL